MSNERIAELAADLEPAKRPEGKTCPWANFGNPIIRKDEPCPVCGMLGTPNAEDKCIDPVGIA